MLTGLDTVKASVECPNAYLILVSLAEVYAMIWGGRFIKEGGMG